ncbi:MAG: hypothetical protein RLZZ591_2781 [Pseudomonadota bacterium]|jgi:hypothetical protein
MNRHLFTGALLAGALALVWVGAGFWGSHVLALAMTALIAGVYGVGAWELHRYRLATATLSRALAHIPERITSLGDWLGSVHASLQNPVRLRIEGERMGLPGPALTPYLVGLLVMLGMLGTFLGMVVTLNGTVFALEATSDLAAMRSAFAAPIKGLGLAFGTSVAGVATSAMLGLMSAMARRERLLASQVLDSQIATVLRPFSLAHQRQETLQALQRQSQALPEVVGQMHAMMVQMQQMGQQLNAQLLSNQDRFHSETQTLYKDLARSVDASLHSSLGNTAQAAAASIQPLIEAAMAQVALEAKGMHERVTDTALKQLETQSSRHEELIRTRLAAEADWTRQQGERVDQWLHLLRDQLGAWRQEEATRGHAAVERLGQLQTAVASHLTTLGTALEAPIQRLIETASEAPRAAAEVISKLRQEVTHSTARDNELLQERSRILDTLNTLLDAIHYAGAEQRAVIDALVATSSVTLAQTSSQFSETLGTETVRLADVSAQVTSSAVEIASLSDTLGFAVRTFGEANDKLITHLQRIESAMDKSMTRSDEQLAYYVTQAREIIDLSLMSQKEIFEELRQLPNKQAPLREGAA